MVHNSLVSVIVPCYNQGDFLGATLDSVLNQTYDNWECIIVNDGSSDHTKEVALQYCKQDPRFRYLEQTNQGVSEARNLGIRSSGGQFVQLLDGDDILESNKLLLQLDFFKRNDRVDIVYGSTRYFRDGSFDRKFILNQWGMVPTVDVHFRDKDQTSALIFRNIATICAPLYRSRVFDGGIGFKKIIYEDWYFHIECSLRGKTFHFERIDGTSCFVRITAQSQMNKHIEMGNSSPDVFPKAVELLLKQYNYQTPFAVTPPDVERNKIKETLNFLLPPFVFSIYRQIKKR